MVKGIFSLFLLVATMGLAGAQEALPLTFGNKKQDSVITWASAFYQTHSFLRSLFMGTNYRQVWKQPVTLPVFYLSHSGLRFEEVGGGMQTKSLQLLDSRGKEWHLRTVDKDVSGALPAPFRHTLARRVTQDMVSAAFPYGAPLAGELLAAAGINAPRPVVVFVADDPALGPHRSIFANTVCTLEERDPGFPDTDNIEDALENLTQSNRYKVQQPLLLKARVMDMLLADWDRHADNWRWGLKDSAGLKYYYAIPRDRDWVFYKSGGLVPWLTQVSGALRSLVSFGPQAKNIKDLSWKAWTLDKNFLNEMDAADWEAAITQVQDALSDNVIRAAVKKLPATVYAMVGDEFVNTLISRRNSLKEAVMKYYRFQAEEVLVNGSDENETFLLTPVGDNVKLVVYRAETGQLIYERVFKTGETYTITLDGRAGADVFEVDEKVKTRIRLLVRGGEGADVYDIRGDIRAWLHDTAADNNTVRNKGRAKLRFQ